MKKLHVLLAAFLIATMLLPACAPATLDCASEKVFCVGSGNGHWQDQRQILQPVCLGRCSASSEGIGGPGSIYRDCRRERLCQEHRGFR